MMAIYIDKCNVKKFRGISNFKVQDLNHINLIVGDNNSGKTSFLESLLLLRNPKEISNVIRVARQRDIAFSYSRVSFYDNFVNMFPHFDNGYCEIEIEAMCKDLSVELRISGELRQVLIEEEQLNKMYRNLYPIRYERSVNPETNAFIGHYSCQIGGSYYSDSIKFYEYSSVSGVEIKKDNLIDMLYVSPIDHFRSSLINNIVRSETYKDVCLRIVQLFDPYITDVFILKNEQTGRPVEYIKHRSLGNMPISTYGDGLKKVLLLANAIAQSSGGALLIDEIDTAIHAKYYDDVFRFIVKACHQFDVQLFVTTHNLEVVDALLATQDYNFTNSKDSICVITLKKGSTQTQSRIMSGRDVFENRESFDFEVRL